MKKWGERKKKGRSKKLANAKGDADDVAELVDARRNLLEATARSARRVRSAAAVACEGWVLHARAGLAAACAGLHTLCQVLLIK